MTARVPGRIQQWTDYHGRPWWEIAAEPDVMIRLKRILPRVQTARSGWFAVRATDEVARDLMMVLVRWPMTITDTDRQRLEEAAARHAARESTVQDVLAGSSPSPIGGELLEAAEELRSYQVSGRDLVHATKGTLIVDDLGLGKTLTGLAVLAAPDARPGLAVTLTALPAQWLRQQQRFYPQLRGMKIVARTALPGEGEPLPDADLYVMPYSMLTKWQHHLAGRVRTVIFDEIQELRRHRTDRYRAAGQIADGATYRVGLTGTPVYNHGGELYNIVDILAPGVVGEREEFIREWAGSAPNSYGGEQKITIGEPDAFRAHLITEGLMLRRTNEDVDLERPAVTPIEQWVSSDTEVLDKLAGDAAEMARLILDDTAHHQKRWTAAGEFDMRMRQATGIAKAPYVAAFVQMVAETRDKIVLYGWHRSCYELWLNELADLNPRLFTGSESSAAKQRAVEDFIDGDARVLIMSLRSGAGLDGLQEVAHTAVFGELDWSPGVHRQCIGRLARPGQTKPVDAFFCVTDSGADPVMLDVLNIKSMAANALVDGTPQPDAVLEPTAARDRIHELARAVLKQRGGRTRGSAA